MTSKLKKRQQTKEVFIGTCIVGFLWLVVGGMMALAKDERPLHTTVITATVDTIELNHYYNREGQLVLRQMLFWEYRADVKYTHQITKQKKKGIDVVVAWRAHTHVKMEAMAPEYDKRRRVWVSTFTDSHNRKVYKVTATSFVRSWTHIDPETESRKIWPEKNRRGLGG